jgi:Ca-activated chloride channel family protein
MKDRAATFLAFLMALAVALAAALPALGQQSKTSEAEAQRQDVIKLETALVTVPVVVTDRFGRFVTGLARSDFQVRENGRPQEIANFSATETPFNVALLLDTSHSTRQKLGAIRKAALEFIKQLQPRDRVLIVNFDDRVRFHGDFTSDHKELARTVNAVQSGYATSLYDAIYLTVMEKLIPLEGRKAIVVLTDGVDTASKQATYDSALELIASTGIVSYAIQYETRNAGGPVMKPLQLPSIPPGFPVPPLLPRGPGQRDALNQSPLPIIAPSLAVNARSGAATASSLPALSRAPESQSPVRDRYLVATDFLRALAFQSGALYLRAESIENTSFAFALIAEELRHQYTLAYYSTNEKRDGNYRTIAVTVKHEALSVRARQGYRAPKADPADAEENGPEKKPAGAIKP